MQCLTFYGREKIANHYVSSHFFFFPNFVSAQCFDLGSFLFLNKYSSGQRWKCAYCENFLSYVDLEHCALTEQAAQRFGDQITNLRNMVEFREDKSMVLCEPVRSHQERARAKKLAEAGTAASKQKEASNFGAAGGANDVVDLLDSDSD